MKESRFLIRPAILQDYDSLSILMNIVDRLHATNCPDRFRFPENEPFRSKEMIHDLIKEPDNNIFVAEINKQLAGFIVIFINNTPDFSLLVPRRIAIVDNFGVHPDFRKQGIGTALINTAETWAKNKGAGNIELNVYLFNTSAIHLYQKLGYIPIMTRMSKPVE